MNISLLMLLIPVLACVYAEASSADDQLEELYDNEARNEIDDAGEYATVQDLQRLHSIVRDLILDDAPEIPEMSEMPEFGSMETSDGNSNIVDGGVVRDKVRFDDLRHLNNLGQLLSAGRIDGVSGEILPTRGQLCQHYAIGCGRGNSNVLSESMSETSAISHQDGMLCVDSNGYSQPCRPRPVPGPVKRNMYIEKKNLMCNRNRGCGKRSLVRVAASPTLSMKYQSIWRATVPPTPSPALPVKYKSAHPAFPANTRTPSKRFSCNRSRGCRFLYPITPEMRDTANGNVRWVQLYHLTRRLHTTDKRHKRDTSLPPAPIDTLPKLQHHGNNFVAGSKHRQTDIEKVQSADTGWRRRGEPNRKPLTRHTSNK